jgi:NAD(P)-dependent dehydrogenase (short-subunit alcohol dehydrogenase family)
LLDTSVESFDAHFAVNARGSGLLIQEFANRFTGEVGAGRILALTSDATVGNMPYGASKGALDRIVIAAARELASHGITANVINPGPVDTGWISDELRASIVAASPQHRVGQPRDTAAGVVPLLRRRWLGQRPAPPLRRRPAHVGDIRERLTSSPRHPTMAPVRRQAPLTMSVTSATGLGGIALSIA